VQVWPADLGMSAGVATDADARVLDAEARPVPGLYACGNDMASVMNGAYPGPGITLGPALTFGYLAALHAVRATDEPMVKNNSQCADLRRAQRPEAAGIHET
jgi:succinate dehydrogenase/fumarate reductase flavoprotein subunit